MTTFNFKLNYEELIKIALDTKLDREQPIALDTKLDREQPNTNQNELYNKISDFNFMYSNLLIDNNLNIDNALALGRLFISEFYQLESNNTWSDLQKTIHILTAFNGNYNPNQKLMDFIKEIKNLKDITDPQSKIIYEQFIEKYINENDYYSNTVGNVIAFELNPKNDQALNMLFREKSSTIYNNNSSYSYFRLQTFLDPENQSMSESGRVKLSFYIGMFHYIFRNETTKEYLLKCYRFIIENKITTSKTTGAFKSLYLDKVMDIKDINKVLDFMKEEVPDNYDRKYLDMYFKAIKKYGVEVNI